MIKENIQSITVQHGDSIAISNSKIGPCESHGCSEEAWHYNDMGKALCPECLQEYFMEEEMDNGWDDDFDFN